MGNLQAQNTPERKAAENLKKDAIIMGEVNGVVVPATTGNGAGSTGVAGDVDLLGTEAQKLFSGKTVIGAGLWPQVIRVPGAYAAKGNTSNAWPTTARECARQVALHMWRTSFAAWSSSVASASDKERKAVSNNVVN